MLTNFFSEINEPIYFFDGKNIVESYQFKELKMTRVIAKMNETYSINWIEDSNFFKRRGNFHGQLLIGITGSKKFKREKLILTLSLFHPSPPCVCPAFVHDAP